MSQCSFIAANVPLEEVVSPYSGAMPINEAAAAGLRPGEDPADNFSLPGFPFACCYCGMDYAVSIEMGFIRANAPGLLRSGDMTPEKAERIADYVRGVLKRTDAVELWTVWLSEYDPPRIIDRRIAASDFSGADVAELYSASCWPPGDPVNRFGGDRPTYHRLRVEA